MLAHHSTIEPRQEAVTEYRVLGPKINGCSWVELRPLTSRKHQVSWMLLLFYIQLKCVGKKRVDIIYLFISFEV